MTHDTGSLKKVALLTGLMMLFGGAEISSAATIVQSKSFGPLSGPNGSTTLTYDQFNPSDGTLSSIEATLAAEFAEPVGTTWSLALNINNVLFITVIGTGTQSFTGAPISFSNISPFIGVGDFPVLVTYAAVCGLDPACGAGANGNLDITYNFIPAAVPLPGSLPLFATGLAALGLLAWRRKRKAVTA